jgi:chromosome segregation ATPase
MVRPRMFQLRGLRSRRAGLSPPQAVGIVLSGWLLLCGGCALAPRAQMDECQQLSRTLRSENARLKDQVLVLESQNRDYADRALDDSRRLVAQDEAIERLETSVQAYQDERNRLETAFRKLTASLGATRAQTDDRLSQAASAKDRKKKQRDPSSGEGASGGADQNKVR